MVYKSYGGSNWGNKEAYCYLTVVKRVKFINNSFSHSIMPLELAPTNQGTRKTKCLGRFPEIRDTLVDTIDIFYRTTDPHHMIIIKQHLDDLYSLVEQDIFSVDVRDSYFVSDADPLRTPITKVTSVEQNNLSLGLVPLITTDVPVNSHLVQEYVDLFKPSRDLREKLPLFFKQVQANPDGAERLDLELDLRMQHIDIPHKDGSGKHESLAGYKLAAGFGIGPNKLGTLAYDAPFHIELHALDPKAARFEDRTAYSGVLGIGFWLNEDDDMLVGQMQSMRGAKLPENVHMGVAALQIAEKVARKLGFKSVTTYSASEHPQFRMHPESKSQMMGDFASYYDSSAKTLGAWTPVVRKNGANKNDFSYIGYRKQLQFANAPIKSSQ